MVKMPNIPRTESQRETDSPVKRVDRAPIGGVRLNMQVFGDIPGYKLHIQPDIDGGLERLQYLGFQFVEYGEVEVNTRPLTGSDPDSRISWHSGTDDGGRSYRSYLMKIDELLWENLHAEYETQNLSWEDEIIAGNIGNVGGRYRPGGSQGLTRIER